MTDIDDLVERLRAKGEWSSDKLWESDPDSTEAADALEDLQDIVKQDAKTISELRAELIEVRRAAAAAAIRSGR